MTKARVNADNASADIQGVTAGTGLTGGGTSGTVTLTNDMATVIDAKGDLVVGTGADTYDNLAAGTNGETLVADSSTSTGLRYQSNFAAGKNKIINGDFGIWQRGTSFATAGGFLADRYRYDADGSGVTRAQSQQTFTPATAPVAGYEGQYFLRMNQSVAGTGATYNSLAQAIEDVRTFAGQTVTVSFWAKAAATTTIPTVKLNQNFGSGGSGLVSTTVTSSISVTTSWTRFSYSVAVPSVSGKTIGTSSYLNLVIDLPLNTTFTLDFWGVQVEAGSVATAFQTATGTIQGELAACQRYYYSHASGSSQPVSGGWNYTASDMRTYIKFPVTMRIAPTTVSATGTNYYTFERNGAGDDFNSFTGVRASTNGILVNNSSEISGTAGQSGEIFTSNASSSIAFTAEL